MSLKLTEAPDLSAVENSDLGEDYDLSAVPEADLLGENPDTLCTPTVTSCVGLCGPIFDPCLGKNVHCGTCEDGGVCDLFTHTCGVPKTDCASLGAECGVVRNSCGTRLTCPGPTPNCTGTNECDPLTNKCVACQNPTCADYGFECGTAWLGCGGLTNTVECGSCGTGQVCNPFYNVCEPTCTPASASQLCADAKAARGVECGFISDGCGGRVKCPDCAPGYGCAAQGEQNKCQPLEKPVECVAANRNCGDLTSVCGGTVHCGDCTAPDVCNANGVCGPPCTPKTCAELGNPACGVVDDGCMGQKKCNDCPNNTQYVCLADHTCCKKKTPADFPAGMCGWQMDDGCGGKLDIPCTTGTCPIPPTTTNMLAQCCVNNNVCPAGNTGDACGQTVTNSCTGAMQTCQCNGQNFCKAGVCTKRKTCADFMANGADGQMCSNGGAFDDGSGTLLTCPCAAGATHYCISGTAPNGMAVSGSTIGTCCTDTASCGTMCNTTVANTCINTLSHTCGTGSCGSRAGCNGSSMMCVTCNSLGATGGVGSPCSNGGAFDVGNGTLISCPCTTGICINGTMMVVSGANKGTCCLNSATCPSGSSNICNYTGSPNNTCTGVPLTCGKVCPSGQHCDSAQNGTCVADNNCSNIGVNQNLPGPFPQSQLRGTNDGNPCNDTSMFYQKTGGGFFNCRCTQHVNSVCAGENNNKEGTCTCTGNTCSKTTSCNLNGQDNGCGVPMSCACNPGDVCFGTACCTPKNQCASPPTGVPAPNIPAGTASCNYSDTCGGSVGMQCCPTSNPTTGLPIESGAMSCVPHAGANPAYGDCVCTPTHRCTDPGIQNGDNDGCGHALVCQN